MAERPVGEGDAVGARRTRRARKMKLPSQTVGVAAVDGRLPSRSPTVSDQQPTVAGRLDVEDQTIGRILPQGDGDRLGGRRSATGLRRPSPGFRPSPRPGEPRQSFLPATTRHGRPRRSAADSEQSESILAGRRFDRAGGEPNPLGAQCAGAQDRVPDVLSVELVDHPRIAGQHGSLREEVAVGRKLQSLRSKAGDPARDG